MKTIVRTFFLLVVIFIFSNEINAQTKLSVQGVIRLSDGNAVEDGLYEVTFKLYDTLTSGNLLWTEIQPQLKVTSGIYSTILGEVTPLDLPFDEFYFLSITIDGEELTPRAPLTSAPYSNSMLGFDNVFPSTGNVGIGTLAPTEKLHVDGNIKANNMLSVESLHSWLANAVEFTGDNTNIGKNLEYTTIIENTNPSVFSMNDEGELTILKPGTIMLSVQFDFFHAGSVFTNLDIFYQDVLKSRSLAPHGTWQTISGDFVVKANLNDVISFQSNPSLISNMDNGVYSTLNVLWIGVN